MGILHSYEPGNSFAWLKQKPHKDISASFSPFLNIHLSVCYHSAAPAHLMFEDGAEVSAKQNIAALSATTQQGQVWFSVPQPSAGSILSILRDGP